MTPAGGVCVGDEGVGIGVLAATTPLGGLELRDSQG